MCIICGRGSASGVSGFGWASLSGASPEGFGSHPGLSPALASLVGQGPQLNVAPISFDILNSANATTAEMTLLTSILSAAWNTWAAVLGTELAPNIRLEVIDQTISGRAQGGEASSVNVFTTSDGLSIGQGAFNFDLQIGSNANGTTNDFRFQVDIDYLRDVLFFDTTLNTANDIPTNRADAFSIFLHEMGHALGYNGFGGAATGIFRSVYDYRSDYSAGTFSGPNVPATLGGPLVLTTGNTNHYGNRTGPGSDLVTGFLMNGVSWINGARYSIQGIDIAVLEDIGLPTIRDAIYDQTWMTTINGGAGIDTFQANYSARTADTVITLNTTSFTAPSTLPANQPQTITVLNIERLNLTLGSGNDTLAGGDHNDILRGGAGNDVLRGNAGADTLEGNADNDTLYGGGGGDTIFGGTGSDLIFGEAGDDGLIQGNQGADTVVGGDGDDWVYGGQDNDRVSGDAGNDFVQGNMGNDEVFGGIGDDTLRGGQANDSVFGEDGNDLLFGDLGSDIVDGGSGDDTLWGGNESDTLNGGDGADTINGGAGNDVMTGGAGVDRFVIAAADIGLTAGTMDQILDLTAGELIDVLDATTLVYGESAVVAADFAAALAQANAHFAANTTNVYVVTVGSNAWVFLDTDGTGTGAGDADGAFLIMGRTDADLSSAVFV